jgi:hypothetical protein
MYRKAKVMLQTRPQKSNNNEKHAVDMITETKLRI